MKNTFILMLPLCALFFNINLRATNGDNEKPAAEVDKAKVEKLKSALTNIASEMTSTEKTYRAGLAKFIYNMQMHKADFSGVKKETSVLPWKKKQIEEKALKLQNFIDEISNMTTIIYSIKNNNLVLERSFETLSGAINNIEKNQAAVNALNMIKNYFANDKWFLEPYIAQVSKIAQFGKDYEPLYKEFAKSKESFQTAVNDALITPVQRAPRYGLLFTEFAKKIAELASLQVNQNVTKANELAQQIKELVSEKTEAINKKDDK